MTERFLGSIITSTPVEPSEGFEDSTASGVWNIHDPLTFGQAGDWPDPSVPSPSSTKFVENLFRSFVYDGNGSTQTITTGIDIASGGLVWIKQKDVSGYEHLLFDTERGATKYISSDNNSAEQTDSNSLTGFSSTGFTLGSSNRGNRGTSGEDGHVAWIFKKQPKFFDVLTYDGDGGSGDAQVSHNLGVTPGAVIIKKYNGSGDWLFMHTSVGLTSKFFYLHQTNAVSTGSIVTAADASTITFSRTNGYNNSGESYIVYLFAHNNGDGGFGTNGDQDIIKCGSYTGTGNDNGATINLGFEPQFFMVKSATASGSWKVYDSTRGLHADLTNDNYLEWNSDTAEQGSDRFYITPTGIKIADSNDSWNENGVTFIYMAIRRGTMASATSVDQVVNIQRESHSSGNSARELNISYDNTTNLHGYDLYIEKANETNTYFWVWANRVCGFNETMYSHSAVDEETDPYGSIQLNPGDKFKLSTVNSSSSSAMTDSQYNPHDYYFFKRDPGFFDIVAYNGTGSNQAITHNLGVTPELIIFKARNDNHNWGVFSRGDATDHLHLNTTDATADDDTFFNDTAPNSATFTVKSNDSTNANNIRYLALLFATKSGISKVGTYTGTGGDINVDCGFTNGSQFVLIKNATSTGNWIVYDKLRGIVDGNESYSRFNIADVNQTGTDYIDPFSSGFTITSNASSFSDLNTNGQTYLFLAIAAS